MTPGASNLASLGMTKLISGLNFYVNLIICKWTSPNRLLISDILEPQGYLPALNSVGWLTYQLYGKRLADREIRGRKRKSDWCQGWIPDLTRKDGMTLKRKLVGAIEKELSG